MVGPRSSGCRKCVIRRVKCDETRPHCSRCLRAGHECPGYEMPIRFIPTSIPGRKSPQSCQECLSKSARCDRKRPKCTRCARQDLACNLPHPNELQTTLDALAISIPSPGEEDPLQKLTKKLVFSLPGTASPEKVPALPSAYNDDAFCSFFFARYFNPTNYNADTQYNRVWMWHALQTPSSSPSSHLALRALVTGFFGNVNHDEGLRQEGLRLYGEALVTLKNLVRSSREDVSFDIISAITLLAICEACYHTGRGGWRKHIRALQTLFPLTGPEKFRKCRKHRALLLLVRPMLISEALISRKRSFLESEDWDDTMSSEDTELKWVIKLGDIALFVPGVSEEVENLAEAAPTLDPSVIFSETQRLYEKLLKILDDVRWWWSQWSSDPDRLPVRIVPDTDKSGIIKDHFPLRLPPPMPGQVQSTILRFRTLDACSGYSRYHAFVIMVLNWINRVLELNPHLSLTEMSVSQPPSPPRSLPDQPVSPLVHDSPLSSPPPTRRWSTQSTTKPIRRTTVDPTCLLAHALCIMEALPTYCLTQNRHIGALHMTTPTRAAFNVLQQLPESVSGPYKIWLNDAMKAMSIVSGFEMPQFALNQDFHESSPE